MVSPGPGPGVMPAGALLPALALLLNAFVWGVSWWPFRQLQAHGLHPLWATALIYLVSVCALLAVRPRALGAFARYPMLWVLVAASGFTNVGFNWAVTVGDVVRVVLLFYLMPAWTVLLAWPLLGEKPTPAALMRLALAMAGVIIILKTPEVPWPVPESTADWLALLGGFSFALTNIMLRKLRQVPAEGRIAAMFGGGAITAATVAGLGWTLGVVDAPPTLQPSWAWIALVLSLGFLAGNIALQYGAARLRAHTTALVMLSEVVFAATSSVLLGASELGLRTWVGGALILAAAAWSGWPERDTAGADNGAKSRA